jgi:hypothetical protein
VPIALTSSVMSLRRPSKREAAPEKLNAIISPSRPKTAPSTALTPVRAPSRSIASLRAPSLRPISSMRSKPTKSPAMNHTAWNAMTNIA